MADEQQERKEIEEYLNHHHLQAYLNDAVNEVVKERPSDPFLRLANTLRDCSDASRKIQRVRARQILNGEGLPALEVEVQTEQGSVHAAVSSGPFDGDEEQYGGRGVIQAVENVDLVLAKVLLGKDPTHQPKIDKLLSREADLFANVVTSASIACCKAGAKQTRTPLYDYIGAICNISECALPSIALSIVNGGHLSTSSLWVQDIFVVPTADVETISDRLLVASTAHRALEIAFREAGQETLHRGPRGGFCNGSGCFEQLMECLVASLETAGILGNVEIMVDVHAARLIPPREGGEGQEESAHLHGEKGQISYDLTTFAADKRAIKLISAHALLDIYVEWLHKYPITAFTEPFAAADVATSKELLIRGNQIIEEKLAAKPPMERKTSAAVEGKTPNGAGSVEGAGIENASLLRIIADESVSNLVQLISVNEERGANAVMIKTSKLTTLSDSIALASRAISLGWVVVIAAVSEEELESEFLAELSVGLRAEQLLIGGMRSANAVAACARLARIEGDGVKATSV